MRAWDTEMLERWTQPSQTHTHTLTTIGWQPDMLAVSTSNWLIEAIKPQRQRALLKPLLPAATDLHPSFFSFIHPSGHLSFCPLFLHPYFHSPFPACLSLYFSSASPAMSLMPCQWASTEFSEHSVSTSPSRNCSSKTCQSIVVL